MCRVPGAGAASLSGEPSWRLPWGRPSRAGILVTPHGSRHTSPHEDRGRLAVACDPAGPRTMNWSKRDHSWRSRNGAVSSGARGIQLRVHVLPDHRYMRMQLLFIHYGKQLQHRYTTENIKTDRKPNNPINYRHLDIYRPGLEILS